MANGRFTVPLGVDDSPQGNVYIMLLIFSAIHYGRTPLVFAIKLRAFISFFVSFCIK